MNDLEQYFRQNDKRLIMKWPHYFEIYERYFSRYRNKEIVILEIGVANGGSLQMWRSYFGPKAKIYGVDIDPRCKELEEENIEIFIGSQSDRKFLRDLKSKLPQVDILIDDGGHSMQQQIVTFEELFDIVKPDGVYLCEDLHTSYWLTYGGGYNRRGTYIEYSKKFIDWLNAWHSEQNGLQVNEFTQTVNAIHYYDSMIIIEKRLRSKPFAEKTGHLFLVDEPRPVSPFKKFWGTVKFTGLSVINKCLRYFNLASFHWK
ncbi:methyltransferase family protein [Lacibacter cauensis]|uniref:Methyltransferase family protein n=1 Tax=Lacibacter cauensis TaxID=510947 RepID=A0A562SGV7_9BACT|nr:class I SAM-dependent methyltransferase [Lacibacter cauensis]TWI80343.1 methyltransferase family protein [Lacibacter cauensis]